MTDNVAIPSAVLGVVNLVGLIYIVGWKLGRYELKVDTLWKYVVEAALVDSRQKGVVVANSPVRVSPEVNGYFDRTLREKLQEYARANKLYFMSDSEAVWHLYLAFDKELIEKVCLPHGLNMGQALIAALHISRGEIQERRSTTRQ